MLKLQKVEHSIFNEYYEGRNGDRVVHCILDLNCVRYMVLMPGKWGLKTVSMREYRNGCEARCLASAEKALSK